MAKCHVCKKNERTWSWQPLGPGEENDTFTLPGSHYRYFPVIGVCESCKEDIKAGKEVSYTYKGSKYVANKKENAMPEEPKIYKTWEEAQEAMDRGETVRVEMEPFAIPRELLQLARQFQDKERMEEWKRQEGVQG